MELNYIIIIIDSFTQYFELLPKLEVTAIAADELWCRTCTSRARAQFVSELFTHFHQETDIKHHTTILYSKEEMG